MHYQPVADNRHGLENYFTKADNQLPNKRRGCKKVGDWSLRVCDHANTGSMLLLCICKINTIIFMLILESIFIFKCIVLVYGENEKFI